MKNKLRLSVSQVKKFNSSKAEWVGKYICKIKDVFDNKNMITGTMFHKYVETGKHKFAYMELDKHNISSGERASILDAYGIATNHYSYYMDKEVGLNEYKVEFEYLGVPFLGFIDRTNAKLVDGKLVVGEDTIMRDWKCVTNFCDPKASRPNSRSGLTTYEEYELQAWLYMIGTGIKICEFPEFRKKTWKYSGTGKNRREYSPDQGYKVVRFVNTSDWFSKMESKWNPVIEEIKSTYEDYKHIIPLLPENK